MFINVFYIDKPDGSRLLRTSNKTYKGAKEAKEESETLDSDWKFLVTTSEEVLGSGNYFRIREGKFAEYDTDEGDGFTQIEISSDLLALLAS